MSCTAYDTNVVVKLKVVACPHAKCGVLFGINDEFMTRRREDHQTFYCPNGHSQGYYGDNDTEKALKEAEAALAREQRWRADDIEARRIAEADVVLERRSAAAYKGHLTRMRKRIANGVCPCCTRSFQNVKRHMATQHPEVLARLEEVAS